MSSSSRAPERGEGPGSPAAPPRSAAAAAATSPPGPAAPRRRYEWIYEASACARAGILICTQMEPGRPSGPAANLPPAPAENLLLPGSPPHTHKHTQVAPAPLPSEPGAPPAFSPAYRHVWARRGFPQPPGGAATCWQLWAAAVRDFGPAPCLGWRPATADGRAGPYRWLSYNQVDEQVGVCVFVYGWVCVGGCGCVCMGVGWGGGCGGGGGEGNRTEPCVCVCGVGGCTALVRRRPSCGR